MQTATIRELKHNTKRVLAIIEAGESVQVLRYNQPVAILSPIPPKEPFKMPDFAGRLKKIYGDKVLEVSWTDLIAEDRGER